MPPGILGQIRRGVPRVTPPGVNRETLLGSIVDPKEVSFGSSSVFDAGSETLIMFCDLHQNIYVFQGFRAPWGSFEKPPGVPRGPLAGILTVRV